MSKLIDKTVCSKDPATPDLLDTHFHFFFYVSMYFFLFFFYIDQEALYAFTAVVIASQSL